MHWVVGTIGIVSSLIGGYGNYFEPHIDSALMYLVSSTAFGLAYTMVVWKKLAP